MEENDFVERLIFCDEATFHISGKVNVHNFRIWGTEQPHAQIEHRRDSPKVNVSCAVSRKKVQGPFFFNEVYTAQAKHVHLGITSAKPDISVYYSDSVLMYTHFLQTVYTIPKEQCKEIST